MYLNSSAGITGINYGLQVFENCPSAFSKKKKDKYIDIFESFFFFNATFYWQLLLLLSGQLNTSQTKAPYAHLLILFRTCGIRLFAI